MRRRLRTGIAVTAALTAAVALYVLLTLPAPPLQLDTSRPATHVLGVVHVHSVRSDGTGTVEEIAAAARRAGVGFVVLTDHGDATRPPDPPRYVDGLLVIDAVEINSREGHIVALGLDEASPYPLAGSARDVIEDLHRQGAVGIAAHPDSPKDSLQWRANTVEFDGIEWLNVDSEWRDESPGRLIGGALRSIARPAESIASLFSRPVVTLRRWDLAARTRPVFGIAGLDAHARIGWREDEEPRQRTALARPTYEAMFNTLGDVVLLDRPLERNAPADAARVVDALRSGRSYSVVRAFAEPAVLEFGAASGEQQFLPGARIEDAGLAVTFTANVPGAPGARLTLLRNGQPVRTGQGSLAASRAEPGVYRVEVNLPGRDMPWIVSNPMTISGSLGPEAGGGGESGGRGGPGAFNGRGRGGTGGRGGQGGRGGAAVPAIAETRTVVVGHEHWTTEHDPLSKAETTAEGTARILTYTLGAGPAYGQYAALALGGHDDQGIDELRFSGAADRPMRISVQVRLRGGERWQRSIYLEPSPRPVTLRLQDFEPVGRPTTRRPIVTPIHSLLFVVDTVNTRPGATGRVAIADLTLRLNRLSVGSAPPTSVR